MDIIGVLIRFLIISVKFDGSLLEFINFLRGEFLMEIFILIDGKLIEIIDFVEFFLLLILVEMVVVYLLFIFLLLNFVDIVFIEVVIV